MTDQDQVFYHQGSGRRRQTRSMPQQRRHAQRQLYALARRDHAQHLRLRNIGSTLGFHAHHAPRHSTCQYPHPPRIHVKALAKHALQYHITSMLDIWKMGKFFGAHSKGTAVNRVSTVTVSNFTSIACTQSRANEVEDFLCQLGILQMLILIIALSDLHYGVQGRTKEGLQEYKLSCIRNFQRLRKLVLRIRHNVNVLCLRPT